MLFVAPQGEFQLNRLPLIKRDNLRAWDAADEYLLNYVVEQDLLTEASRVLVVNDGFGALAVGCQGHEVVSWNDSCISHDATLFNYQQNKLAGPVEILPSTETPTGIFQLALIKVPKTLALLEHQLAVLSPVLTSEAVVVAGGMSKAIHTSTLNLFERYLGATQTSLAKKKARLIFPSLDRMEPKPSPYPSRYNESSLDIELSNHANVFSRERLDIGARFFIEQFAKLPAASHCIDLGCGNGVLGLIYQRQHPDSRVSFIDQSHMAVASAQENHQVNLAGKTLSADFLCHDCLPEDQFHGVDLILCNPPFHQEHSITDHIAWTMLNQSFQHLRSGGQLWLVGNRHLNYHTKMKRVFGNCSMVSSNSKFVVLKGIKR